jgi:hypothetical protein
MAAAGQTRPSGFLVPTFRLPPKSGRGAGHGPLPRLSRPTIIPIDEGIHPAIGVVPFDPLLVNIAIAPAAA